MRRFMPVLIAVFAILIACRADAAPPVQMEHISVVTVGTGDDVILIPGLASPRAVWDGVVPALAKRHRVHLVQVNGFGGDDPRRNLEAGIIDGVVANLAAYAARARLRAPAVVGHSLGGLIAMKLALAHPAAVGRVMVVDALPFFGVLMMPNATAAAVEPRAAAMRAMILGQPTPALPIAADPGGVMSITPAGRIQVASWGAQADRRVVAQAMYEDVIADLRGEVAKIRAPFTVLYAAGAPNAAAVWEPAYAGSGARLVAVPGSYHFIMLDQPARFAKELDGFLAAK